jgi:hypothetical protein
MTIAARRRFVMRAGFVGGHSLCDRRWRCWLRNTLSSSVPVHVAHPSGACATAQSPAWAWTSLTSLPPAPMIPPIRTIPAHPSILVGLNKTFRIHSSQRLTIPSSMLAILPVLVIWRADRPYGLHRKAVPGDIRSGRHAHAVEYVTGQRHSIASDCGIRTDLYPSPRSPMCQPHSLPAANDEHRGVHARRRQERPARQREADGQPEPSRVTRSVVAHNGTLQHKVGRD